MKYTEFRQSINEALSDSPDGMTWKELKRSLQLPYDRPCPTWIARMEMEIGLNRQGRRGREQVWIVQQPK